jgi:hypothetical protein
MPKYKLEKEKEKEWWSEWAAESAMRSSAAVVGVGGGGSIGGITSILVICTSRMEHGEEGRLLI